MGKIVLVNKPKGITSFDVCFKMRKIFNTKRIGHTGTLDPNATGLMMVLIDKATKINQFVLSLEKEYIATVKIGIKTDSEDIDGKLIEERNEIMPNKELIEDVLKSFIGKSKQIPPMTSAIKVNGKKLYEYQRNNQEVDVKPRDIEVFDIELLDINKDSFIFKTTVSSGTYIRTLAKDILNKMGIIGTLLDLKRTKIDNFKLEDASTIEDIENGQYQELNVYDVLSMYYPVYQVDNRNDVINGKSLKLNLDYEQILCVDNQEVLAIYYKDGELYRCKRGLLWFKYMSLQKT